MYGTALHAFYMMICAPDLLHFFAGTTRHMLLVLQRHQLMQLQNQRV